MFCPFCGQPDQNSDSFCRNCGTFLHDYDKLAAKQVTPEQHVNASNILSVLTGVCSLILAITLYVTFLPREDTPFIIYVTAGFLTAMFAWQVQIVWRGILLRRHFKTTRPQAADQPAMLDATETRRLPQAPARDDLEEYRRRAARSKTNDLTQTKK